MKKRQLGNTSLTVTELGFGGASIGNLYIPCTNQAVFDVLSTSWDLGIRYFDTAPEYGNGLSERRMGDMLRDMHRDEYVLSTKVGDLLYAIHDQLPPINKFINKLPFHLTYDYSYDGVMRGFEDSLQRLGLNRIDILLVHDLDPVIHDQKQFQQHFKTYIEGGYKALSQLRDEGIIQAIGLGVKQWEVCSLAMKHGDYECFMLQGNYTLLEQPALDGFMADCIKKQISILLAGPYASGILATGPVKGAYFHHSEANDAILKRVQLIQDICDAYDTPIQAAAIQFPLHHPAVASVVVGSASAQSMRDNVKYLRFNVPLALWEELKSAGIIPKHAPISG
jgi:D-threo-aldose 1-dehydrogenase